MFIAIVHSYNYFCLIVNIRILFYLCLSHYFERVVHKLQIAKWQKVELESSRDAVPPLAIGRRCKLG
jgi:hypothetical protein